MLAIAAVTNGSDLSAVRLFGVVVLLVAIALFFTSQRLRRVHRIPVIAALTAGGWAMVAVGMALGPFATDLISHEQIDELHPLLILVLGWIGLVVGLQASVGLFQHVPHRVLMLALVDGILSAVVIGGAALGILVLLDEGHRVLTALPAAAVIAACSVGWSPEIRSLNRDEPSDSALSISMRGTSGLGAMLAILLYGTFIASTFDWVLIGQVSGLAGPALRIGISLSFMIVLALAIGMMGRWMMQFAGRGEGEFLVVLLGTVCFGAGVAVMLSFPPVLLAMLIGAVIVNLPGRELARFQQVLVRAEQPVAMMLMLAVGVMMDLSIGIQGLILVAVVITARLLVKYVIMRRMINAGLNPQDSRRASIGVIRQSPLGLALAVAFLIGQPQNPGLINSSELLTVIAMVGLVCEILPISSRLFGAKREMSTE